MRQVVHGQVVGYDGLAVQRSDEVILRGAVSTASAGVKPPGADTRCEQVVLHVVYADLVTPGLVGLGEEGGHLAGEVVDDGLLRGGGRHDEQDASCGLQHARSFR